jgi:nitrite transporter NirC
MMYAGNIDEFAKVGAHKVSVIIRSPLAFLIGAAMAATYIGFGDILMFSVGSDVDPAYAHLIMGAVFACALTIVVFGTAMYLPLAALRGETGIGRMVMVWVLCWIENLVGAVPASAAVL